MSVDSSAFERALRFVESADFDGLPHFRPRFLADPEPPFKPDDGKDQAVVVGSGILSFAKGVTSERRIAISNSTLFAQLMANKAVGDSTDVAAWYRSYFQTLTHLGWVVQDTAFAQYVASGERFDVHDAILQIAGGLVGGAATSAFALIKLTLDTLEKAKDKSPWLTVFARESQHAHAARFQVSLAQSGANDDFLVTLMAFDLDATSSIDQVLFFKFRTSEATLKHYSTAVSIDDAVLSRINPEVERRIAKFTEGYIKQLPDL